MQKFMSDSDVVDRVLSHVANGTTDRGEEVWREPVENYRSPERLAESERLKAHARKCMRASLHPNIVRDRVKMDFDGLFRLAPLPRAVKRTRRMKVYTQNSMTDYRWNPIPFAKEEGFGPASVWPAEFYAAMAIEAEILEEQEAKMDLSCHSVAPCEPGRLSHREPDLPPPSKAQTSASHCISPSKIQTVRNGSLETPAYTILNPIPLEAALSLKTYRDLF